MLINFIKTLDAINRIPYLTLDQYNYLRLCKSPTTMVDIKKRVDRDGSTAYRMLESLCVKDLLEKNGKEYKTTEKAEELLKKFYFDAVSILQYNRNEGW